MITEGIGLYSTVCIVKVDDDKVNRIHYALNILKENYKC
jgi:hypothetical protein